MKYKAVHINEEGNSAEPVQYVGVYALKWKKEWGMPEIGFVESGPEITEEEIKKMAKEAFNEDSDMTDDELLDLDRDRAIFTIGAKAIINHIEGKEE